MINFWDIAYLILILGVMVLVFYFSVKLLKKFFIQSYTTKNSQVSIEVLQSKVILPKRYLSVVKVNNECYLLGISDQNINLIDKIDGIENIPAGQTEEGRSFMAILKENMGFRK